MNTIPLIMIVLFFAMMLFIIRKQLGVSSFEDYATANRSFGFFALTFSVLATWVVGAMYTAWAGMAVTYGFTALYCIAYATITMIVMYYVAPKTYIWGVKYGIKTQSELLGFRYQSKSLRMLTGVWGIVFTIPWLIVEIVTQGYVFEYATGGLISQFWGMVLGIIAVAVFVSLGGMRSVITANVFQGLILIFGGTALMIYFVYKYFGGFASGFEMVVNDYPGMLTYPGPGWEPPTPYWTSIVILSGLGGFLWPWAYNKLFASDSIRTIKVSALLAPIIYAIFFSVFVVTAIFIHSYNQALSDVQGAFLWIASESGPIVLGLLGVIIMASSVGTVSGIMQAISTTVSRDLAQVIDKNISDKKAVNIARISVIVISLVSLFFGTADLGLMVFLALFTYDGIILLFPIVILGLYWKRANKEGAIIGLIAGTALSMFLRFFNPSFIEGWGWQPGVYGLILSFAVMITAGYMKKPSAFVEKLWVDTEAAYTKSVKVPAVKSNSQVS
ncbi:sodium:solute symporter family protein [Planococcus shenhongbingii]|uniref:sodium:solute symporter family protein n=1 Tax=Planococcus shenhongbingii TaxID=3058398 RepID=UPI002616DEFB|nr:sodium:solute symporter family protein [Planococcus sp. N016]WKA60258.1 sodium:solute symporter family protein [Planococcus sp. N016]